VLETTREPTTTATRAGRAAFGRQEGGPALSRAEGDGCEPGLPIPSEAWVGVSKKAPAKQRAR